jgi:hypothetical protein
MKVAPSLGSGQILFENGRSSMEPATLMAARTLDDQRNSQLTQTNFADRRQMAALRSQTAHCKSKSKGKKE